YIAVYSGDSVYVGSVSAVEPLFVTNPDLSILKKVASITNPDGTDGGTTADQKGDVIKYTITVANTGNITLTNLLVTDKQEGSVAHRVSFVGGDSNSNGALDVGETWTYSTSYTVTQADLDSKGGGNSLLDNTATAKADQAGPKDSSASVPLAYSPDLSILKKVASITNPDGTDGGTTADQKGDVIKYTITVANTGNITLTNLVVTDKVEGSVSTPVSFVLSLRDALPILDVGETWTYSTSYTVTQADLDS